MVLSSAQLLTLKNDILADPALAAQPSNADGAFAIAAAYNLNAVPAFWVWRTAVTKAEYVQTVSPDGTSFLWSATGFITRTVQEQVAWQELFGTLGAANPSLANVRQAFADIFSGAGNAALNRTHLTAMSRRLALRGERLYATGTGSTGSPGTMVAEGTMTYQNVQDARAA